MNLKFEKEIIERLKKKGSVGNQSQSHGKKTQSDGKGTPSIVYEGSLDTLQGLKIAIDASLLLAQVADQSNPRKFIQEGAGSIDLSLQQALTKFMQDLRVNYKIDLLVVVDGLVPKHVNEKQENVV